MTDERFAALPPPPYFAVIFSARRTSGDDAGYAATAQRMLELAREQPGFLGEESARDDSGFGITVSYWQSEEAIRSWREHAEHRIAQQRGHREWYRHFELRVARVERAWGKP